MAVQNVMDNKSNEPLIKEFNSKVVKNVEFDTASVALNLQTKLANIQHFW